MTLARAKAKTGEQVSRKERGFSKDAEKILEKSEVSNVDCEPKYIEEDESWITGCKIEFEDGTYMAIEVLGHGKNPELFHYRP